MGVKTRGVSWSSPWKRLYNHYNNEKIAKDSFDKNHTKTFFQRDILNEINNQKYLELPPMCSVLEDYSRGDTLTIQSHTA